MEYIPDKIRLLKRDGKKLICYKTFKLLETVCFTLTFNRICHPLRFEVQVIGLFVFFAGFKRPN